MKKLLLLFAATLVSVATVSAQCTPDPQYTQPGIYPDSATGFPDGYVGVPYALNVTNVVPVDTSTTIGGFPVTFQFDSIVVTSFTGLPAGFSYACADPSNTTSPTSNWCTFEGGTAGCIYISGTTSTPGTYNLTITVDVYMEGGSSPFTTEVIDWYKINILQPVGLEEQAMNKYVVSPNPASTEISIAGLTNGGIETVQIYSMNGQLVKTIATNGYNVVDVNISDLDAGVYFATMIGNQSKEVVKFIKD